MSRTTVSELEKRVKKLEEVLLEEKKDVKTYRPGDCFEIDGVKYILVEVSTTKIMLVETESWYAFDGTFQVCYSSAVTKDELDKHIDEDWTCIS